MVGHRFESGALSRHVVREARRERIPIEMIAAAYDDPDDVRDSEHDDRREIRTRWIGDQGIELVVDRDDGRIVSVWRKGVRQ